jgi:hypothetical protein
MDEQTSIIIDYLDHCGTTSYGLSSELLIKRIRKALYSFEVSDDNCKKFIATLIENGNLRGTLQNSSVLNSDLNSNFFLYIIV